MLIHQNDKSHADDMNARGVVSIRVALAATMYWHWDFVVEFVPPGTLSNSYILLVFGIFSSGIIGSDPKWEQNGCQAPKLKVSIDELQLESTFLKFKQ
jgi:hypothetical protein